MVAGIGLAGVILWVMLGGEMAILSLSFAAAHGKASCIVVFLVGYLTAVIGACLWFSLVRKISPGKIKKWKSIAKAYNRFSKIIDDIGKKKYFSVLFWSRSFYGGGISAIIYLAGTGISFWTMLRYSLIVDAFWAGMFVLVGLAAGSGFRLAMILFQDIKIAVTIAVVIIVIFYAVMSYLKHCIKSR